MIEDGNEQRSPGWYKARLAIPTASNFDKVVSSREDTRRHYMFKLIAERVLGRSLDEGVKSKWMMHGIKTEPEAIEKFKEMNPDLVTRSAGFMWADNCRYGCSLDQVVVDRNAAVEIKCPAPHTHCEYMVYGPGDKYKAQIQGQMLVTGFEKIYFFSYFPGFTPVSMIFLRDDKYIKALEVRINNFCDDLEKNAVAYISAGPTDIERALSALAEIMPEINGEEE